MACNVLIKSVPDGYNVLSASKYARRSGPSSISCDNATIPSALTASFIVLKIDVMYELNI